MNLHVDDLNLLAAHGLTGDAGDLEHSLPTPVQDASDNIDGESKHFEFLLYVL